MPRITITISELLYYRLRAHAEFEEGTTISRAAADILADFLAEDDEVLESQDATWGRFRERSYDSESGDEYLTACTDCGGAKYPDKHYCTCGKEDWQDMRRSDAMDIKLREIKKSFPHDS